MFSNFAGPTGKPLLLAGSDGGKIGTGGHLTHEDAE
jgi:hypothetical protein